LSAVPDIFRTKTNGEPVRRRQVR